MKNKLFILVTLFSIVCLFFYTNSCKKVTLDVEQEKNTNVVISVEFADTQGFFKQSQTDVLNRAFNTDENGLKNFIYKNSNKKVVVNSVFSNTVKIEKTVNTFMPRYTFDAIRGEYQEINPDGYDNRLYNESGEIDLNGKPSSERYFKEQDLLYGVISKIDSEKLGLSKDEKIKNVTVVFSKLNVNLTQADLFWPHQAKVYKGEVSGLSSSYYLSGEETQLKEIKLGDKSINNYIFIPYAFISDGENLKTTTLCHEYMHVLGAPDLYRSNNKKEFVGEFDVMGGKETEVPNLSLSYVRYKLGWLSEGEQIKALSKSGEYILYPTETGGKTLAYKITLTDYFAKGESFYIEYRNLGKGSLSTTLTEGIIIYRVNEDAGYLNLDGEQTDVWRGNALNEEISLFRYWREIFGASEERDEITKSGICYATVFDKTGYTVYGSQNADKKSNAITYSDGVNSRISVEFLEKTEDGGVKIKVELPEISDIKTEETLVAKSGNRHVLTFNGDFYGKTAYVLYLDKKISNPKAEKIANGKYGKPIKVDTAFLQTTLPKFDGFEKYVYVFYGQDGVYTSVTEHKIVGIKDVNLTAVLVVAIAIGATMPILTSFLNRKKSRVKEGEDKEENKNNI